MTPTFNQPPLVSANRQLLSRVAIGFPNASQALMGTLRPLTIERKTTTIKDGQAQQVLRQLFTKGRIQPMSEDLDIKAEGDRSWEWWTMYSTPELELTTNDVVVIEGVTYKVMRRWLWRHFGYRKFALITGFQG